MVLPPGVVCDPCNHGALAVLDSELLSFMPISLMRVTAGVPNKAGELPVARFSNARLTRHAGNVVEIESPTERVWEDQPGGFKLHLEGRRMTPKYTSTLVRALYKSALGLSIMAEDWRSPSASMRCERSSSDESPSRAGCSLAARVLSGRAACGLLVRHLNSSHLTAPAILDRLPPMLEIATGTDTQPPSPGRSNSVSRT
jgi:hypothetical protein